MTTHEILGVAKPLIAMIHLPPLPGAANFDGRSVRELATDACAEAELLRTAGFDAVMLQNTHDRPSRVRVTDVTVAAMASIATAIADRVEIPLGINVHKNNAEAALAVAVSCGAAFVRVKVLVGVIVGVEGVIEGAAARAADIRREYAAGVELWADLYELTSWPLAPTSVENLADLATRFGGADRLIVTDPTVAASRASVERVRTATSRPVLIGGRTTPETIGEALATADGVVVGTTLRTDSRTDRPIDPCGNRALHVGRAELAERCGAPGLEPITPACTARALRRQACATADMAGERGTLSEQRQRAVEGSDGQERPNR